MIFACGWATKRGDIAPFHDVFRWAGGRKKIEPLEIVTIDGPAGAGKSTVSKILARRLNYMYLDTGAMYRAVALRAQVEGIDPKDEPALERLCSNLEISFRETGEGQRLICQGEDITERIREAEIGWMASVVSTMRPVREALGALQRKLGSRGGVVAEGRDMGTVVFPGARFKFFLVANPRERSLRRYRELQARGREMKLEEVEREVRERDAQDASRELAPLKPAKDAHLIDSTGMTPEEVVAQMMAIIHKN